MSISCRGSLLLPTYYFPEAFWNNHLTVNKTLTEIAAPLADITSALHAHALMPHIVTLERKLDPIMHVFGSLTLKIVGVFGKSCG